MKTIEEVRAELERIAWKHYDPEASINVEDMLDEMMPIITRRERAVLEEERRFILNVLDGIDIADKQMGVVGGTKAIRFALQSRYAGPPHEGEEVTKKEL